MSDRFDHLSDEEYIQQLYREDIILADRYRELDRQAAGATAEVWEHLEEGAPIPDEQEEWTEERIDALNCEPWQKEFLKASFKEIQRRERIEIPTDGFIELVSCLATSEEWSCTIKDIPSWGVNFSISKGKSPRHLTLCIEVAFSEDFEAQAVIVRLDGENLGEFTPSGPFQEILDNFEYWLSQPGAPHYPFWGPLFVEIVPHQDTHAQRYQSQSRGSIALTEE